MAFIFQDGRGRRSGPLTPVIKGLAAGIGLASESLHYHNERKAAKKSAIDATITEYLDIGPLTPPENKEVNEKSLSPLPSPKPTGDNETDLEKHEEEQWTLDEAQEELISTDQPQRKRPFERDPKKMAKHFTDYYPVPEGITLQRLSLPVILPQRRPKARARGFIRAYAPELQKCGIDQAMFTDFLDTFNVATLASPWLNAINLASFAFMTLPTAISQAASIALAIAVEIAKNMQSRSRYSSILDQMNDDFYRPRGLYALVLTWNPESDDMQIGVNLNEVIGQNLTPPDGIAQKASRKLRPSMGNSNGVAFPESAPLIFPELDSLAADKHRAEAVTSMEKVKHAKGFLDEYLDRRAQAQYAGENPDSHLNVGPKPKFTSRYSDPNNASNNGSLISLLTAGKVTLPPRGMLLGGYYGNPYGSGPLGRGRALSARGFCRQRSMDYMTGNRSLGTSQYAGDTNQQAYEQFPDQKHLNQQDPDQMAYEEYPSQQYPNQQYQNQMGCYGGMANQGLAFGVPGLINQGVRRIFRHHVLYLMIVNMPSEEELAEATHVLNHLEQQAQSQEDEG